jgi:hypothetical protein
LSLISLLAQIPHTANAQTISEKWAVVVAVAKYNSSSFHSLPCAETDGKDLSAELERSFGVGHVLLLNNANATKGNIRLAICEWLDLRESSDDTVLFFFSGHGSSDCLYSYDSLPASPSTYIASSDLDSWLDTLESEKTAIILNSCNAGDYITQLDQPGRILLSCGDSGETCWGCTLMEHSYFTHFLIEAIGSMDIDSGLDGEISVEEIFNYASMKIEAFNNVISETHGQSQHPKMIDNYSGEMEISSDILGNAEVSVPNVRQRLDYTGTGYPQYGWRSTNHYVNPPGPPPPPNFHSRTIKPFTFSHNTGFGQRY